jgi:CBS domain-containing protein
MQTVSEVMTRNVQVISPQESLQRAAQLMDELNVGALPVCNGERLVGMVTDRDITIRGSAEGRLPQEAHVDEVMSGEVRWCFEDQPLDEVMIQMADSQVRRIPVVSHDEQHRLVGIVSLGDVATRSGGKEARGELEEVVEMVSAPSAAGGGSAEPIQNIVGRTGEVGAGGTAEAAAPGLPAAGESGIGAAGASGQPREDGAQAAADGEVRPRSGVGGQDLSADGLPPA